MSMVNFLILEEKMSKLPMFKGQNWCGWTVVEDSPAGCVEVIVEKCDNGFYSRQVKNKVCVVPSKWLEESD